MATKKQKEAEAEASLTFVLIPFIAVGIVFALYHYAKLKKQYLTGSHVRRVFDLGSNWTAMMFSSILAFGYFAATYSLYRYAPWSVIFTVPLGLVVLNWVGEGVVRRRRLGPWRRQVLFHGEHGQRDGFDRGRQQRWKCGGDGCTPLWLRRRRGRRSPQRLNSLSRLHWLNHPREQGLAHQCQRPNRWQLRAQP